MRNAGFLVVPLLVAALACEPAPTTPDPAVAPTLSEGQNKTAVCHLDKETGTYVPITIADPALAAHTEHGDGEPGELVPGNESMRFTETCALEVAVKTVFVTRGRFSGHLGGLAGADATCQAAADAAGLVGMYKAWLSSSTTSAADRLVHHDVPYVNTHGVTVAADWADIVGDGILLAAINYDEYGASQAGSYQPWIWSSTSATGQKAGDNPANFCSDWTSTSGQAVVGAINIYYAGNWSMWMYKPCAINYVHLYCFEQ